MNPCKVGAAMQFNHTIFCIYVYVTESELSGSIWEKKETSIHEALCVWVFHLLDSSPLSFSWMEKFCLFLSSFCFFIYFLSIVRFLSSFSQSASLSLSLSVSVIEPCFTWHNVRAVWTLPALSVLLHFTCYSYATYDLYVCLYRFLCMYILGARF